MNLFGTDGIRNRVGSYPFTHDALPKLGKAIATWAHTHYGDNIRILIGRDTRYSGPWITSGLLQGLLSHPITIYDAGILPTAALFHLLKEDTHFQLSIVVTASHNPATDNGIKLVGARGKLSRTDEEQISKLMASPLTQKDFSHLGELIPFQDAKTLYRKFVTRLFPSLSLAGKTIVLDCAHGAASISAPQIFKDFGADIICINNNPDGYNINHNSGSTHPEILSQMVVAHQAYMGFSFDGDGDRVIAVNNKGQIKDGDDLLAILQTGKDYCHEKGIVSTIMANQGLEACLAAKGKTLIRSNVGDKYVMQALIKEELSLGGEPSGHIILRDLATTGDGIIAALKIVQIAEETGNLSLESFTKFPQVTLNVPVKRKKDLTMQPLATYIAASKAQLSTGRLLVRYSGTEPVLRIMAEGEDLHHTSTVAHHLANSLKKELAP